MERTFFVETMEFLGYDGEGEPEWGPVTQGPFFTRTEAENFAADVGGVVKVGQDVESSSFFVKGV